MGPDANGTAEVSTGVQNMKTGPGTLDTAANEFGSAKHENGTQHLRYHRILVREHKTSKWDLTPSVLLKTIPGEQNMKTGLACPRYRIKRDKGAKHENGK
jgi:hypothetical protein